MKKYVKQTMDAVRKYIDEEMKNAPVEKTNEVLSEFETKIAYFQHERLIHLMVTLAFAAFLLFEIFCLFYTGLYSSVFRFRKFSDINSSNIFSNPLLFFFSF